MNTQLQQTLPLEQREYFLSLQTPRDLANLLEYRYSALVYHIYKISDEKKYQVFEIPKKTGGYRTITAPTYALKLIQRRLSDVLQNTYKPKPVVFGFVEGRDIVKNARAHKRKNWVLNIDLEGFFPSINFGRVRGMFMSKPYNLPDSVATVIAQICCFKNELPQGAPTSPIISNMICAKMDSELQDLAWKTRCFYTRYADDITFSTTLRELPSQIATVNSIFDVKIGNNLEDIIISNGFKVNPKKTRAFSTKQRQEVTGLTVNKFPNVRRKYIKQIRAMLYAWEKYGLEKAESVHSQLYSKNRNPKNGSPSFTKVVKGKIEFLGMVKGKENNVYLKFKKEYQNLIYRERGLRQIKFFNKNKGDRKTRVYTEGITDALILQTAWKKLYPGIELPFIIKDCNPVRNNNQRSSSGGSDVLKNYLKNLNEDTQFTSIGIFDKDDGGLSAFNEISNFELNQNEEWKISSHRKAGCFPLPTPEGKEKYAENKNLCIEFYFSEEIITTKNKDGKGLSLSLYLGKKEITADDDPEIIKKYPEMRKIKDDGGKMVFASEIIKNLPMSAFEPFKLVFDKILKLIEEIDKLNN